MKKYWIERGSFANVYNLFWTDNKEMEERTRIADRAEPISRKEAERLCAEENSRRKYDPNFSGFADNMIYPADYEPDNDGDLYSSCGHWKNGHIWEKRGRTK